MALSAFSGPLIAFGEGANGQDNNPDSGPSLFAGGIGLLDNRKPGGYSPGQSRSRTVAGWYGINNITTIDYIPTTLGSATICAVQTPVSGTPLVLPTVNSPTATVGAVLGSARNLVLIDALRVSLTGSIEGNVLDASAVTGTITPGTVIYNASGTVTPSSVVGYLTGRGDAGTYLLSRNQTVASTALIGAPGLNGVPVISGNVSRSGTALYNPMTMVGRGLTITTASGDTAIYTLRGYDVYGMPMSENIQAAGPTQVNGKKAFKWLASVTPNGTVGVNCSVGTSDIFGFPLYTANFSDVTITWANAAVTATTGYLAGVGGTATATTGDVRGTYAVQSASDGSKRLTVRQSPSPMFVGMPGGLYGVTQA